MICVLEPKLSCRLFLDLMTLVAKEPQIHASAPKEEQAIVIGDSIAGMLAARVLADHFDLVTIVERDFLV